MCGAQFVHFKLTGKGAGQLTAGRLKTEAYILHFTFYRDKSTK